MSSRKTLSYLQMYEFKKECCAILATIVTKIQKRSPLKYSFARELASLDPRLIVVEPDTWVLTKIVDTEGRTTEQADGILTQYKKFLSEMKQFYHEKFASFKFGYDRLDAFFHDVLNTQKTYEDLWITVKIPLNIFLWSGCCRKRFLSEQRSSCTKSQRR